MFDLSGRVAVVSGASLLFPDCCAEQAAKGVIIAADKRTVMIFFIFFPSS